MIDIYLIIFYVYFLEEFGVVVGGFDLGDLKNKMLVRPDGSVG